MSTRPKIYLAGPISGLTYDQGQGWRELAVAKLDGRGMDGYSPLRAKGYLKTKGVIEQGYEDTPLSTDHGITTRDRWDVQTADAVLFFMRDCGTRVSVGTCIEFGWADARRIPIVVVMEKKGNVHDHPMVRDVTGFRVETLDEAIELLDRIFNPHNVVLDVPKEMTANG